MTSSLFQTMKNHKVSIECFLLSINRFFNLMYFRVMSIQLSFDGLKKEWLPLRSLILEVDLVYRAQELCRLFIRTGLSRQDSLLRKVPDMTST
ncbi:hypothetical protein BST85_01965 [Aureitalea marina]|uniref:Uncharacterized protein n=1 Tax=Aureitalea marina TaxID=930804 RepID=A0A2S7KME8_9FLAO|nr:hypothetical protein BST85_01965 [Aureitalea marina]